ncbi:MAG TPA: EamA family transporter [Bacteroidia bacterium]|nr:EamA family transporter [Bacteroidia bacterium]
MNKSLLGHLSLFGANLIYSINYSIAKDVLGSHIQSSGFILLRAVSAMILYWLTSLFMRYEKIAREDRLRLFFCGVFGVAANQLMFFKGLSLTSPINASIMMVCTPILVVLMGYFALTEKITLIRILGILTGLAGAVFLILNPNSNKQFSVVNWGDLLVLLNACSWGLYLIIVKPLMQKYHTITVIKWVFLIGFIIVLPFGYNQLMQVQWETMPTKIYWEVFFVVFATTYLAYILNTYSLKNLSPAIAGTYIYAQPLLTALFAVILGKDEIDFIKITAALMIFSGVYMASKTNTSSKI